ncbi:SP family sugar porter-like MFS transporter [Rhodopirellula rubra]|uniref:SP family sugar porter-like MFS transporter n=1 Tax=Aporhodopirellula rubra TaxID=980271 RepID=A0A7W5E0V3_9BACT|nr:sugar porter family MFS transporter [Aporhodopirellula rubra]MBB3207643.1 SP family sugar porter-like MFS transporter [Aporhodopirellula rubra]
MGNDNSFNLGYLFRISLVAALGGLLFGYDWVVIGGAKPFYEPYFDLVGPDKAWLSGWAMSSALAGCLAGALLSGALTDSLGRKKMLIFAAVLFTASAAWTALAQSFNAFIAARILGGIGIGLASNVSPIYIAEVSPTSMRGKFVSLNQLTIVIGVLAAQVVNLLIYNYSPIDREATAAVILDSWSGQYGWRWMFAAETIPAGLFFLLALVIPESPRWLLQRDRVEQAEQILTKIGGSEYAALEASGIRQTLKIGTETANYRELLNPKLLKIVGLGVFIAIFQQWCGINVIFNYAQEIFSAVGYDVSGMMFNIVITGIVNLVFTLVAINTVDRWGRRPLMLLGSGGLMVTYAILGACYYYEVKGGVVLVVVLTAIACYAMTLAPITWVLLSEIFPNRVRGAAMSLCVSALWIACFALTATFKPINVALGASGTFWLYGLICLIGFVVLYFNVPETKNKSLEEIERDWK